jgi:hypothetical protein
MSDVYASTVGARARADIDFSDPYVARYWSESLNVDVDELRRVIDRVGPCPTAIRRELGKWRAGERATD